MSGFDDFAPFQKRNGCFVVRNVTSDRQKTINIFQYPIPFNKTRDLLAIPGVGEADIRASLLKGELQHKILCKDIVVECSDIDLLQFNSDQRKFLQDAGIVQGMNISYYNFETLRKEDMLVTGTVDSVNKIFNTPNSFVQDTIFKIIVYLNGVKQLYLDDYFIAESLGPGTGYNTIVFNTAPKTNSVITADYYVKN